MTPKENFDFQVTILQSLSIIFNIWEVKLGFSLNEHALVRKKKQSMKVVRP